MKKLKFLAWAVLMVLTCAGFAACSDDDDDAPAGSSEIVGTWYYDHDVEPEMYTFKKDGTFVCAVWGVSDPDAIDYDKGTYRYDEKSGTLQLFWNGRYDDYDIYDVIIVGDKMILTESDGYTMTLYRR